MSVAVDKASEQVLCVAATAVKNTCGDHPVSCVESGLVNSLQRLGPAFFERRGVCETDETLKQIIPYVVLMSGGKVFCYSRGSAGGEGRLHRRKSIGIGGHINPVDRPEGLSLEAAVLSAASRELTEEVGPVGSDWTYFGLINDDSDEVGRVHVGVGLIFEVDQADVLTLDPAIAEPVWLTAGELWGTPNLEKWSQIVVRNLFPEGGVV